MWTARNKLGENFWTWVHCTCYPIHCNLLWPTVCDLYFELREWILLGRECARPRRIHVVTSSDPLFLMFFILFNEQLDSFKLQHTNFVSPVQLRLRCPWYASHAVVNFHWSAWNFLLHSCFTLFLSDKFSVFFRINWKCHYRRYQISASLTSQGFSQRPMLLWFSATSAPLFGKLKNLVRSSILIYFSTYWNF